MRSSRCTTCRNNARKTHPLARTQDITIRAMTVERATLMQKASGTTRSAKPLNVDELASGGGAELRWCSSQYKVETLMSE